MQTTLFLWAFRALIAAVLGFLALFTPDAPASVPWAVLAGLSGGLLLMSTFLPAFDLKFGLGRLGMPPLPLDEQNQDSFAQGSEFPDTINDERRLVDPWDYHRALMFAMHHQIPAQPMMTRDSLMYYALLLEEAAQAGQTLLKGLAPGGEQVFGMSAREDLEIIRQLMASTSRSMSFVSRRMNQLVDGAPLRCWDGQFLPQRQAQQLLDDLSALQMMTCGFALATGLPVEEGYRQMSTSCISKAQSGKEVKEPDFDQLLKDRFTHYAETAH